MKRPRKKGLRPSVQPRPTSQLLDGTFRWLKLDEHASSFRAMRAFSIAAGPRIGEHARGERLRGSILYVRCDSSSWSQHLHMLKGSVLERLHKTPGGEGIAELRFNVGPLDEVAGWEPPAASAPAAEAAPHAPARRGGARARRHRRSRAARSIWCASTPSSACGLRSDRVTSVRPTKLAAKLAREARGGGRLVELFSTRGNGKVPPPDRLKSSRFIVTVHGVCTIQREVKFLFLDENQRETNESGCETPRGKRAVEGGSSELCSTRGDGKVPPDRLKSSRFIDSS